MTEAVARAQIVAYGKLLWRRGLVAGSSGNVSVRLDDGSLIVTPAGRALRDLAPGELVRTGADGTPHGERGTRPTSELPLHVAAYRARGDVACVVHAHPTHVVGWSKTGALFPLDTVGAIESLGTIAFARYAPSGTQELADICCAAFALPADTVVMARHGLSTAGTTLEEAFLRAELAEQTAHIELVAHALRADRS